MNRFTHSKVLDKLVPCRYTILLIILILGHWGNGYSMFANEAGLEIDVNFTDFKIKPEVDFGSESIKRISTKVQEITVSGTILDSEGIPLPGANVLEKGVSNGTQTDFDGNFSLTVSDENAVLVVSFIGFATKEVPLEGRETLNITLEDDAASLDEVVVVGYGTQQKGHLTGAIGSIDMEELDRPTGDFGQAMYGEVAGVRIQNSSGQPGASSRIQIRGITSLSGGSGPLIVIDGTPMPSIDLNTINSSDIASIEILKDAASAAIYGSRAANGVVLVTTKRGSKGEANISVNYTYSIQTIMNEVDMMSGPQYAQAAIDAAQAGWVDSGGDPNAPNTIEARGDYKYTWPEALENPETLWDTDWQDLTSRAAPMHKADISTSGGGENSNYYLSGGVLEQEGMIPTTGYQRYTLNMNGESSLKDWLKVGGMLNVSYDNQSVLQGDAMNTTREYPSIYPEYGNNGYLGGPLSIDGFENHYNILMRADNQGHPYWHLYGFDDDRHSTNTLGKIFTEISLLPGLKFISSFNASYLRNDRKFHEKKDRGVQKIYRGEVFSSMSRSLNYTFTNVLNYDRTWGDHQISAVAGYEYNQRDYYYLSGERDDFDNDLVPYLSGGSVIDNANDDASVYALMSIFGRFNYNFKEKYLISATLRRDGSSRFGPANRWGNFPSISAGWKLSEENFINIPDVVNNLMIRASYGLTGNDGFPNYAWISRMQMTPVAIGNNSSSSYYPSNIENPDLAWERTRQFNIGLDVSLMSNRFTLEANYYNSISDGLLLNVPIPTTSGFGSIFRNIGELETNGFELGLTSRNLVSLNNGLSWTTNLTISKDRSLITKLGPNNAPLQLNRSSMDIINAVGEVPFSFYAYKYDGVYMNQQEIDAHGVEYNFEVHPGDGRYVDINNDGQINADDRTIIGNNQPDFIWGLNNSFSYGNFDLNFAIGGSVGGEIYNAQLRRSIFNHEGRNYVSVLEDRWRSEEEPGDGYHYKLNVDLTGMEKQPSDYWLVSGTYARLRNLTLGYTIPTGYTDSIGIKSARIFFNGTNLLNWQEAETIADPENTTGDNNDAAVAGVQFNSYPTAKTISFGVNVKF